MRSFDPGPGSYKHTVEARKTEYDRPVIPKIDGKPRINHFKSIVQPLLESTVASLEPWQPGLEYESACDSIGSCWFIRDR